MLRVRHVCLGVAPAALDKFRMVPIGQPPIGVTADLPGRAKVDEVVAADLAESLEVRKRVRSLAAIAIGAPLVDCVCRQVDEEHVQLVTGDESVSPFDQKIDSPVFFEFPVVEVMRVFQATHPAGQVGPVEDFDARHRHRGLDSHRILHELKERHSTIVKPRLVGAGDDHPLRLDRKIIAFRLEVRLGAAGNDRVRDAQDDPAVGQLSIKHFNREPFTRVLKVLFAEHLGRSLCPNRSLRGQVDVSLAPRRKLAIFPGDLLWLRAENPIAKRHGLQHSILYVVVH